MELRILRYFLTVAREENITRAAETLPMPGKEWWGALVPAKCPLAQKQYITREDLAGRRVFMTYRGVTQGVSDWFGDYYDKMDVFAVYNLVNNAATLVDCGMGAAITIEGAVALYKNPNIVFRPFYPELAFNSTVVWKSHQPMSRTVAKFIEFLKRELSDAGLESDT